jgi:SAM-dependent methyltransferase
MTQWYEELFVNFADQYEKQVFTTGTLGEVDFIEQEIGKNRSVRILDIGCGTGRHSIELARRGYSVVGVDLSNTMLKRARTNAQQAGVQVDLQRADARQLHFREEFGLAIMMCEGGFPLMETDEMNHQILRSAANALTKGGTFIFTTLNGLFPLFHSVKDFLNKNMPDTTSEGNTFDLMTFRDISTYDFTDDDGRRIRVRANERYYVPSEITWLLKSLGFSRIEIFGAKLGAYSRQDSLTAEDYEMLVVAKK